jgi:hypothetical protein
VLDETASPKVRIIVGSPSTAPSLVVGESKCPGFLLNYNLAHNDHNIMHFSLLKSLSKGFLNNINNYYFNFALSLQNPPLFYNFLYEKPHQK